MVVVCPHHLQLHKGRDEAAPVPGAEEVAGPDEPDPQVEGLDTQPCQALGLRWHVAVNKHVVRSEDVAAAPVVQEFSLHNKAMGAH